MRKLFTYLSLALTLIFPTICPANFFDDFESTSFNADWSLLRPTPVDTYPDRIILSTAQARSGVRSTRFWYVTTDPHVANGHHCMLQLTNNAILDTEFWFGISVYQQGTTLNTWDIFWQWHQNSGTGSPPLSIRYVAATTNVVVDRTMEPNAKENNGECTNYNSGTTTTTTEVIADYTDTIGKWYDYVANLKIKDDAGIVKLWINGTSVIDLTGVDIGYVDCPWNYLTTGIYTYSHVNDVIRYVDEFRLNTSGSYASVCPDIAPKAPAIVYPLDGADSIPTSFTADYDEFLEGYADASRNHITDVRDVFSHKSIRVQLSRTQNWASPDVDVTNSTGELTEASITGLIEFKTYYIRACYISTAGVDRNYDGLVNSADDVIGPWSAVTSFYTAGSPTPSGSGGFHWSSSGTGKVGWSSTGTGKIGGLH